MVVVVIICGSKLLFLLLIMVVDFTLSRLKVRPMLVLMAQSGRMCAKERERGDNWWFVDKEEEEVDKRRRCEKLVTFLKVLEVLWGTK